jgi:hypothetical protein
MNNGYIKDIEITIENLHKNFVNQIDSFIGEDCNPVT